jgi:pimeloyl-ACP methyl ester carboxylesterase
MTDLAFAPLELSVGGLAMRLATMRRAGERAPVLFLHGFGSTKEDYADLALEPAFDGRGVLAYDAPGCGESACDDLAAISIPLLADVARSALDAAGIERFHLVGHSMGGLTALMLADAQPERVLSFVDIEGNLGPEDCFLSRQILTHPADDAAGFFDAFVERTRRAPHYASALYAASLRHKVRAEAVGPIFRSMVELSDHGDLLRRFLELPFPRMFMHGEQNSHLSYLPTLAANGVEVASVPRCGHFPMYSNPAEMWRQIGELQDLADGS